MAAYTCTTTTQNPSQRGVAMVLALVSAIVLSPLYINWKDESRFHENSWSSGLVVPMVLAGLIIAIRTTSSPSSRSAYYKAPMVQSQDPSWVLKVGSSSWGLTGVLLMLMLVLSWQHSVQEFLWR